MSEARLSRGGGARAKPRKAAPKVTVPKKIAKKLPVADLERLKIADWDYVTTVRPQWTQRWTREIATP